MNSPLAIVKKSEILILTKENWDRGFRADVGICHCLRSTYLTDPYADRVKYGTYREIVDDIQQGLGLHNYVEGWLLDEHGISLHIYERHNYRSQWLAHLILFYQEQGN